MRIKKAKVLQAKFYINIMIRFGKKEKGDGWQRRNKIGIEVSNTRSSNLPCT